MSDRTRSPEAERVELHSRVAAQPPVAPPRVIAETSGAEEAMAQRAKKESRKPAEARRLPAVRPLAKAR